MKPVMLTLGALIAIGGLGYGAIAAFAAGMSDAQPGNPLYDGAMSTAKISASIGLAGIAVFVGGFFV